MKAVIMAGGFGTRIQPLTHSVPKPMVPLLNKPMMANIVGQLRDAGISDIVALLYHMPEVVQDYFGDGSAFGVNIHYVIPDEDLGTAGAVKSAEEFLDDTFIVISGDVVADFPLEEIIEFHRKKDSPVTITLTSVPNPLEFGVVITDHAGKILRFLEKPGWGEVFSDTINTGIYLFEPEIFNRIPQGEFFDFSKDLFPIYMREDIPIFGYNADGYWRDVGNIDSYREVLRDILHGKVRLDFPGEAREFPGGTAYLENPAMKFPEGVVVKGKVVIGRDVKIGKDVILEDCVIGDGVLIKAGATVKNSALWRGSKVAEDVYLDNVVLCGGVSLCQGVRIGKGGVVAEGVVVGERASFERDLMVWPGKKIEAGSVLSSNLVWGDKWKKTIFERGMVRGDTNVELSPEFAAKLGASLGSVLPPGSSVLVSRDYRRSSRMLKRAFLGGVLSTGTNVNDIKMTPVPVTRYKLSSFGEEAGVHFQQSGDGPVQTQINFYDHEGNLMDTSQSKAIERLFFKENFRRASHSEVGEIRELHAVPTFYREGFVRAVDADAVRARRFNTVIDFGHGTTGGYLPELLNMMGCRTVALNSHPDERRLMRAALERGEALSQVGQIVKTLHADGGFFLSPGGEYLYVVDEKGRMQPPHRVAMAFLKLFALVKEEPAHGFLPVTESRALDGDEMVEIVWGKTTGVKTSELLDMDLIVQGSGRYAVPSFLHAPDAMFSVAKILELLSLSGCALSEVFDILPKWHYNRMEIGCPVSRKGRVMREMTEFTEKMTTSLVDGVQVEDDGAYVLLLPDSYRPIIHLVAQGPEEDVVLKLSDRFRKLTEGWVEER